MEKDETTVRVYKRDALIMKQLQSMLEMRNRAMTQAELIHRMFDFLTDYQDEFFKEVEARRRENERLMEEWTRFMLKRMKEM
ncbi:MAG: hypothetical protein QXO69_01695 [archaeon]